MSIEAFFDKVLFKFSSEKMIPYTGRVVAGMQFKQINCTTSLGGEFHNCTILEAEGDWVRFDYESSGPDDFGIRIIGYYLDYFEFFV